MEYASYLESLQPEQRVLELKNSQPKALGAKRSPSKPKQVRCSRAPKDSLRFFFQVSRATGSIWGVLGRSDFKGVYP